MPAAMTRYGMGIVCKHGACNREALHGSSGAFRVMPAAMTRYGMDIACKQVACNREALHGSSGAFRVMPAAMTRYDAVSLIAGPVR